MKRTERFTIERENKMNSINENDNINEIRAALLADGDIDTMEALDETIQAICEEVCELAESIGDSELAEYMRDGETMSRQLDTLAKWNALLSDTRSRAESI